MTLTNSDYIAIFALFFSLYATYKTLKFSHIQNQLNLLMIEKEKREAVDANKADLGVNFYRLGKASPKLKIFNKGKATAFNVNIEFPEGNDLICESDINQKLPYEQLERGQSVELLAYAHLNAKRKLAVKLIWQNENKEVQEKQLYASW